MVQDVGDQDQIVAAARSASPGDYHWTYGLDGKLVGASAMERTCDFDREGLGLPNSRVELWNGFIFVNIPPTLSFVFLSDVVLYLTLHAESAGAHAMSIGWFVRSGAMEEPLFDARMAMNMGAAMEITAQDLHVDEWGQIGLQSKFAPRGRYAWQEPAQRDLNVWLVERYRRAWARQKGEAPEGSSAGLSPAVRHAPPQPAAVD
jgi:hypothetical protein